MRSIERQYRVTLFETRERVVEVVARTGVEARAAALSDARGTGWSAVTRRVVLAAASVDDRLAEHSPVGTSDECWVWTGSVNTNGYGQLTVDRRTILAHRTAYEREHGSIPEGKVVMHSCDNPPCVNPAHLSVGTTQDNQADKVSKNRHARGEANGGGGKLTEGDVIAIRQRAAAGERQASIAAAFGISKVMVGLVVRRKQWAHVA